MQELSPFLKRKEIEINFYRFRYIEVHNFRTSDVIRPLYT